MDLSIEQMMQMQLALYEQHRDSWPPMEAGFGKEYMLYMVEEIGEAIAILKKKGTDAVMNDEDVRCAFLAEMADVLMYYHDILLRFHVTAQELSEVYMQKHNRNLSRDYIREYEEQYHG